MHIVLLQHKAVLFWVVLVVEGLFQLVVDTYIVPLVEHLFEAAITICPPNDVVGAIPHMKKERRQDRTERRV